ncbi:hypothetical protein LZG03_05720 [Opitutaceae bacterium LMO-CP1]|uniref:Uncharacterized protein n=1 Tax=Synoicihabitans lomoniglobus TaxID=2909285 RepID=A0AAE9ZUK2_9BACT|nr:hypothetical protein [Opitutaceae bacterium LMO-M01]WED63324.1 hypothetical protein PXH66_13380 [Opitutaceae bacterium LMO-M01]
MIEFPFSATGRTGGNQACDVGAIRVRNAEHNDFIHDTDGVVARFSIVGAVVRVGEPVGIFKNSDGLVECDMMLGEIGSRFSLIPLKQHTKNVVAMN